MKTPLLTATLLCALSLGLTHSTLAAPNASPTPSTASATGAAYGGFLLDTKIVGSHIMNLQNQDIGTIDDLVVNPDTGHVRFAVLGVGGFLGLDETKVVVPWGAISLKKNAPGSAPSYVIDATKDKLEKAPRFDASKLGDLYARAHAQPIFDYYDIIFFEDLPTPDQSASKDAHAKSVPSPTPTASPKP